MSKPYRAQQNPAEPAIRDVKMRWYRIMFKKKIPKRLWDYGIVWICETGNISVSSSRYAKGRTSIECITGETPDISEYTDFSFYDWILYRDNAGLGEPKLGRWLGVSHKIGELMSYYILPISCQVVISCVTVQRLTNAEQLTREFQQRMDTYDKIVGERLSTTDTTAPLSLHNIPAWNSLTLHDEDPEFIQDYQRAINDFSIPDADLFDNNSTPDTLDPYVHMQVGLP